MAKWLTRWSAKPVFMGSNPIRCSKAFLSLSIFEESLYFFPGGHGGLCAAARD